RQAEQSGQERNVVGREGVAAGAEDVERLAVAVEDRLLAFANDQLGAEAKLAGAALRDAVDDFIAVFVRILDQVEDRHGALRSRMPGADRFRGADARPPTSRLLRRAGPGRSGGQRRRRWPLAELLLELGQRVVDVDVVVFQLLELGFVTVVAD